LASTTTDTKSFVANTDLLFGAIDALDSVGVNEIGFSYSRIGGRRGRTRTSSSLLVISAFHGYQNGAFLDGNLGVTTVYYDTVPAQMGGRWEEHSGRPFSFYLDVEQDKDSREVPTTRYRHGDGQTVVRKLVAWIDQGGQLTEIEA
jgi:hypothetical protein